MSNNSEYKVTSELLSSFERDVTSKPNVDNKNVVSKFTFGLNNGSECSINSQIEIDEDGDYLLRRKEFQKQTDNCIFLEHSVSTELKLVGLQIWRAAFLLADFIIHFHKLFLNTTVLELGSGVGLTSIVAGMFAKKVICTDIALGNILDLIKSNIERNKTIIKGSINVVELDFFNTDWPENLSEQIKSAEVIIAADVIYDNDVTEAFVKTIEKVLSMSKKTLFLALEKRYVFTISDLDCVAPCYEHLKSCLKSFQSKPPFSQWSFSEVPLDFPQYFNYDREKHLVLLKISS